MSGRISRALARIDSWLNLVTGVGGTSGKVGAFDFTARARLPDETLQALYEQDGYAARIIDCVPDEATRQGLLVKTGDEGLDARIAEALEALVAQEKLTEAWAWGRLYGGGAVFIGADDGQDPREPLRLGAVRGVKFLTVLERRDLFPERWVTDPLDAHFGDVETYRLVRAGGGGGTDNRVVHRSRLLRFFGARVSPRRRSTLEGWGASELQRVYDKLQQFNATFAAVGELLQDGSQGVFKVQDLYGLMAEDKQGVLKQRLELLDMSKSVARSILVDAESEEYQRVESGAMSGYPDTIDRFALLLAGAAGIPVTILLGQAPAGLNATGDSDIRWFYDRVRTQQANVLKPRVLKLARLLVAAEGAQGAQVAVDFPPLWQETPAERADRRSKVATTDVQYIQAGVITAEEVAVSRFGPDGWSDETTVDLDARREAQGAALEGEGTETQTDGGVDHEAVTAILGRVAARAIPRTSGLAMLAQLGMPPDAVEATMGETGVTFFTAPEPGHAAEMDSLRAENAKLTRSQQSTKAMLSRVLERNRAGELVVGRLIARAPTDTEEGDVLEEGDTVPVDPAQGGA
jgi:phage-related protein (TIGR01555 family)